jgi:hypothetical protein
MAIITHRGKLTLLRVHDVGTGFGPPSDFLDGEVVVKLDSRPDLAFGFQLREDGNRAVRTGMLGLLRDAYTHKFTVSMDVDLADGRQQGRIFRVWLEGQQGGGDDGGHDGPQFPHDVIIR